MNIDAQRNDKVCLGNNGVTRQMKSRCRSQPEHNLRKHKGCTLRIESSDLFIVCTGVTDQEVKECD